MSSNTDRPSSPTRSNVQDGPEFSGPHTSTQTPPRPQLHIDTTTPVTSHVPTNVTPPRSREGQTSATFEPGPTLSGSPSIRSQRSEAPRVRFSSDVQTLGERSVVSPSITEDEALARLNHSPSQSSLTRRQGSIVSELPYVPVTTIPPPEPRIKGILRSPSTASGPSAAPRRPGRPRGWSLRRQLFSKQDPSEQAKFPDAISLATLPTSQIVAPPSQPRHSRSIEDIDAIRVVNTALEQARIDPPITPIHAKHSTPKRVPTIEPEVTQASLPFYSSWATSHRRHEFIEKCKDVMRRLKRLRDPRLISKGKGRIIPIDIAERGKSNLIDERTGREYVDNLITSSRYTVASFLPRQLWAQFSKVANLYATSLV